MKKKQALHQLPTYHHHNKAELEIIKAVAQAWFSHHYNPNLSTDEFDARRRNFHGRPSRFRIEAMKKNQQKNQARERRSSSSYWDFNQSLWDPYEIVAVSKRLEQGLVLDEAGFSGFSLEDQYKGVNKKKKESKHSLRHLIDTISSRRYNHPFLCSLCPEL